MKRRIKKSDGYRQAFHGLQNLFQILSLHREKLADGLHPFFLGAGQDHLPDDGKPVHGIKHSLCPAEANPFGSHLPRLFSGIRGIGIGPHTQGPDLIGPFQEGKEIVAEFGLDCRDLSQEDLAGGAIDRDEIPFLDGGVSDHRFPGLWIDMQFLGSGNAGFSHAPGHDGRMRGLASPAGQNSLGRQRNREYLQVWSPP